MDGALWSIIREVGEVIGEGLKQTSVILSQYSRSSVPGFNMCTVLCRVLWGGQHIGEVTPGLLKRKKAKQKVKQS